MRVKHAVIDYEIQIKAVNRGLSQRVRAVTLEKWFCRFSSYLNYSRFPSMVPPHERCDSATKCCIDRKSPQKRRISRKIDKNHGCVPGYRAD